jgi:hypothetical protein
MKAKSVYQTYKPFWENGKTLYQVNPKIGYTIKNYAVNSIFKVFQVNKNCFNGTEKDDFGSMIKELSNDKKALNEDVNCTAEEFAEFLEHLFANVDDEDRHGDVTMKTSATFKLIGELINVLESLAPEGKLPDEWMRRSK